MVFGEYLILKKILTTEQVVKILAYQIDHIPSLYSTCLHLKLLDTETLLIIAKTPPLDSQFLKTIKNNNYLNSDQLAVLFAARDKYRIPFGQICVKLNFLNILDAQKYLNEYLKEISNLNNINKNKNPSNSISLKNSDILEIQKSEIQNSIESSQLTNSQTDSHLQIQSESQHQIVKIPNFKFDHLDEELMIDFCSIFDENKRNQIEIEIMSWTKKLNKDNLRDLYREMHTLKGTARFLNAHLFEYIIHHLESLLNEMILNAEVIPDTISQQIESLYINSFDLLWNLRTSMLNNSSEEKFYHEIGSPIIENLINQSENLTHQCIALGSNKDMDSFIDQF